MTGQFVYDFLPLLHLLCVLVEKVHLVLGPKDSSLDFYCCWNSSHLQTQAQQQRD